MRILTVADKFFPDAPGGLGRVAWDVAKAMARRGHQVGLLAGDRSAVSRTGPLLVETVDGVRVVRYPKPAMSALDPFRDTKQINDAAAALREVLGGTDYDVIHSHSIYTAHAAIRAAPNIPVVQTVHSPTIQELSYNWRHKGIVGRLTGIAGKPRVRQLELQTISKATRRHALSRFTVDQMQIEYRDAPGDYEVIPHWADPGWFRSLSKAEARERLGWPNDEPILFSVRQLRWRYGIDTAIEAIAPAAKEGRCRFFIAGEGEQRRRLEEIVRRHAAEDKVRLLGRISDEDLRLAYQAADVFILPTRALECFGLIILEALACGLPVIGTSVGAIPENLEPILPDLLVPGDDPAGLRRTVEDVLAGRLQSPPASALVDYVSHRFGESQIIDRYEQLFASAIGR
jgi:glycosyltransferase involved in cell wall biosynthesis